jgi:predicted secreted Zn-dependent protease
VKIVNKYLSAGIIIVLFWALTSIAGAEPTIKTNYDYYDIEGRTAAELRDQMNRNGVLWTDGNTYDAYTGWNVRWKYRYRITDYDCSISSVATTLNVEFRLPRWTNYASGAAALRRKWDKYMQSLRRHENGHRDLGVQAAIEIERSIAALEPAALCDDLAEAANELGRSIVSEYTAKEREYDEQTNYGESQGAVFPPAPASTNFSQ